jgi:fructan beta-fructosidase
LFRWEHLEPALREEKGVMIFSGSAVVDHKNTSGLGKDGKPPLVAIYTGHGLGKQTQNIAHSNDRGRTWTKYAGNPVIDIGSNEFRDPKVIWHEGTKRWVMVVARPDRQAVMFYGSGDLKRWEQLGEFGGQGAVNGIWECPDLFEVPVYRGAEKTAQRRWVLVVNINGGTPAGGSGCQYFVGEFDGKTFVNDHPKELKLWADYGADFYAAQSFSDVPEQDGRRIWLAWMSNWRYANKEPTKPWRTAQSVVRELTLSPTRGGLRLRQRPVAALEKLRHEPFALKEGMVLSPGKDPLKGSGVGGECLEIILHVDNIDAKEIGLRVRTGDSQQTLVGFDALKQKMFVDRIRSGRNFHDAFPARHEAPVESVLAMRVLVDRSSVEVFGDDGLAVISDVIFPDAGSTGVELYVNGGRAVVREFRAWKLKSAWR